MSLKKIELNSICIDEAGHSICAKFECCDIRQELPKIRFRIKAKTPIISSNV